MKKTQIMQRMKSGNDNYIRNGGSVGRKVGFKTDIKVLLDEHKDAVKLLKRGYSTRKIIKLTDKIEWYCSEAKNNIAELI